MSKSNDSDRGRMWAMLSDRGTAMPETALTADEFADARVRAKAEAVGLRAPDCSRVSWADVTENDAIAALPGSR